MSESERKYTGFAAIYQLEQEMLKRERVQTPPENTPSSPGEAAAAVVDEPAPTASTPEVAGSAESAFSAESSTADSRQTEDKDISLGQRAAPAITRRRSATTRVVRTPVVKNISSKATPSSESGIDVAEAGGGQLASHVLRWKQAYRLNKGEINVMKVMFGLTHEHGISECYIKIPEVAEAAHLKKRRCQYVIRGLEILGFLERLEDYDPSKRLGTKYRLNLKPSNLDI